MDKWEEAVCVRTPDGQKRVITLDEILTAICEGNEILKERQKYFDQSVEHHNVEYNWLTELNATVNELYQKLDTFVLEAQETRKETQLTIREMKDVIQQHSTLELELFRSLIDKIGNGSRLGGSQEQDSQKKK
jgi:hypothetical protein